MKTKTTVTKGENVNKIWQLIDLKDQTLGRACTQIAALLMGKNNLQFSFHRDDGEYVIAINAGQIVVTGKKAKQKIYYHHTGYAGHLKEFTFQEMMKKDPREVILHGVAGMLPKNHLRADRLRRLKVFVGADHPYAEKLAK
jgi:large subunit ribosomal protein L13